MSGSSFDRFYFDSNHWKLGFIHPEIRDWKQPIRHLHCGSKSPQLLPSIVKIQGLRAAKPWNHKRGSACATSNRGSRGCFCREDERMLVPKRIGGLGWTLNFARPLAVPFLGFLLALVAGVVELANALGGSGDLRFAVTLLSVLGLIAVGYRLSKRRRDSR